MARKSSAKPNAAKSMLQPLAEVVEPQAEAAVARPAIDWSALDAALDESQRKRIVVARSYLEGRLAPDAKNVNAIVGDMQMLNDLIRECMQKKQGNALRSQINDVLFHERDRVFAASKLSQEDLRGENKMTYGQFQREFTSSPEGATAMHAFVTLNKALVHAFIERNYRIQARDEEMLEAMLDAGTWGFEQKRIDVVDMPDGSKREKHSFSGHHLAGAYLRFDKRFGAQFSTFVDREILSGISGVLKKEKRRIRPLHASALSAPETEEGEVEMFSLLPSEGASSLHVLMQQETQEQVADRLGRLRPTDHTILANRFGLEGQKEITLKEIGRDLGVTRERVRQRQNRALEKLRRQEEVHPSGLELALEPDTHEVMANAIRKGRTHTPKRR